MPFPSGEQWVCVPFPGGQWFQCFSWIQLFDDLLTMLTVDVDSCSALVGHTSSTEFYGENMKIYENGLSQSMYDKPQRFV